MPAKEYKLLLQQHESRILSDFERFLSKEYAPLDQKVSVKFLKHAKKILQIVKNFQGKVLTKKDQEIIEKIVKDEFLLGIRLGQALKTKMALRSSVFRVLSSALLCQTSEKKCLKLWEWYDRISQQISFCVVQIYESIYLKNIDGGESSYKRLLDRTFDIVLIVKADGHLEYFNKQLQVFSGYSRSQLSKMHFTNLFHPGDHAKLGDLINGSLQDTAPLVMRLLTKQNLTKKLVLEFEKRFKGKRFLFAELVGRDLSVDEGQKTKLDERYRKMQEAYIELGKVNRQMAFLQESCVSLASDKEFQEIVRYTLYVLAVFLDAENVIFREMGPQKMKLIFVAAHNLEEEWRKVKFIKNKRNVDWHAVDSKRVVYVPNIKYDNIHNHYNLVKKYGFQSSISFPIFFRGEISGVVTVLSKKADAFYEYSEEFVGAILGQLAVALFMLKTLKNK